MEENVVRDLFTAGSIATFGGASSAVVVVTNTVRRLTSWNSPIPAFLTSLLVALAGAYSVGVLGKPIEVLLAFLNACLLFCSAMGIQESLVATANKGAKGGSHAQDGVKWLSSWIW